MGVLHLLWLAALLTASHAALQLASVIFRHGHRNIMRTYDFDPYTNVSYWPGGIGEITNRGKMQMYQFGQLLKERYRGLLSEQYNPEETLVRSSSVSRCVNSALCVLAGLFPPGGSEIWNPSLLWQPVPVYATRKMRNNLLQAYMACPAYDEEFKKQMTSPEVQAFNSNYSDVYHIISEHWKPVHDFVEPNNLYNHFMVEEEMGFKLPDWAESIYPEKLREISNTYQVFRTSSPLLMRLKMGPIVKEITKRMSAKRSGTMWRDRKLFLYSGHDDTITGMLKVLGVPNEFEVQIGAAVFIELHANDSEHYEVKTFFMSNTDLRDIREVHLPICEAVCGLDTFLEAMSPWMPSDWENECQFNSTKTS